MGLVLVQLALEEAVVSRPQLRAAAPQEKLVSVVQAVRKVAEGPSLARSVKKHNETLSAASSAGSRVQGERRARDKYHMRGLVGVRRCLLSSLAADDVKSLKSTEVALKMMAARVTASMSEGVGVVEAAGGESSFAKDDIVYSRQFSGVKSVAKIDGKSAVKIPEKVPHEMSAFLAQACAAYRMLASTAEGDVVVNFGGETAVGQCLAQFAKKRGVTLVSLTSPEIPSPDDAVDHLKNIGAHVSMPSPYCRHPHMREIIQDVGKAKLVLIDASAMDVKAINAIFSAFGKKKKFSKAKDALVDSHHADLRDAKLMSEIAHNMAEPGAQFISYDARPGDELLKGTTKFSLDEWFSSGAGDLQEAIDAVTDAALKDELRVWVEAYNSGTLFRAIELRDSGVMRHAFREPIWVDNLEERE